MQIHQKIKVMRLCKGWKQADMAEKLNLSLRSYAKIERGEVDIKLGKLREIAKTLGANLNDFIDPSETTVLNFAETLMATEQPIPQNKVYLTETQCTHELEKVKLILQQKDKEIAGLQKEISHLEEIILLLKKNHNIA